MKIIKLAKTILISCAIIMQTVLLNAQDGGNNPLSYGVKVGLSQSVLTFNNQPSSYHHFAPIIGGFAQYSVLPWVSASAEVLYTQHGGTNIVPNLLYSPNSSVFNFPGNIGLTQSNLKIHSLEVPIYAKVGLPNFSGSVKPFLSAGLSIAFNMKANAKNYFTEYSDITGEPLYYYSVNDNVTSRVKATTMSFITGAGVQFEGSQFNCSIEVFYKIGLTDINVESKAYIPDYRVNTFGVKVGIGL